MREFAQYLYINDMYNNCIDVIHWECNAFGDAMSFPILVITIITYYLISRMIKESVVLILLTTVVSYFAWMILAVTIFDYIPRWFTHIDIQISYIIGILLQVLIVNFVSRLYLKFNKSNSNKPL